MIAAVLAGGRSRRMGAPKALAVLGGAPLIARPLAAARAAGLQAVVVAKPGSLLPELDVPVWREPAAPVHPLCGLIAALERGPVVAVACDQPWVTAKLLAALAAQDAAVAVPAVAGRLEPFPGRYDPSVLEPLRAALAAEAPLRETLESLAPARLDLRPFGDPARLVASVNTPEELAAAERALAAAAERTPAAPGEPRGGMVAGDAPLGSSPMPPTAEQWLESFAAALGRPAPTAAEIDAVLQLASVAAHASERRAAPVACWLAATAGIDPVAARELAERLGPPA